MSQSMNALSAIHDGSDPFWTSEHSVLMIGRCDWTLYPLICLHANAYKSRGYHVPHLLLIKSVTCQQTPHLKFQIFQ